MPSFDAEGFDELIKKLDRMPRSLAKGVRRAVQNSMINFERAMQERMRSGPPALNRRNGALARSFHQTTKGSTLSDIVGTATIGGTAAPYAAMQEFGGTNRKPGGYLAVPLPGALTKGGRLQNSNVGFLRGIPNVYIVRSKRTGNLIAFKDTGKKTDTPIAVLKTSVTLKPRLGFFATWNAQEEQRVEAIYAEVQKVLDIGGEA